MSTNMSRPVQSTMLTPVQPNDSLMRFIRLAFEGTGCSGWLLVILQCSWLVIWLLIADSERRFLRPGYGRAILAQRGHVPNNLILDFAASDLHQKSLFC